MSRTRRRNCSSATKPRPIKRSTSKPASRAMWKSKARRRADGRFRSRKSPPSTANRRAAGTRKRRRRSWNSSDPLLPLLEERAGVRSSLFTDSRFMVDAGPHPGPLPSDGRGNGNCAPWVDGGLSGQCSRRFSVGRQTLLSPLSAVGPAKADGGGRGEVEASH